MLGTERAATEEEGDEPHDDSRRFRSGRICSALGAIWRTRGPVALWAGDRRGAETLLVATHLVQLGGPDSTEAKRSKHFLAPSFHRDLSDAV